MKFKLLLVLVMLAAISGCGSTDVVRAPIDVTIGQQLIDLKKAHDNGVLNAREYDSQRRLLIENVK